MSKVFEAVLQLLLVASPVVIPVVVGWLVRNLMVFWGDVKSTLPENIAKGLEDAVRHGVMFAEQLCQTGIIPCEEKKDAAIAAAKDRLRVIGLEFDDTLLDTVIDQMIESLLMELKIRQD